MSESELREMLAKTAGAAIRVFINGEDIKALLDDLSTLRARVAEVERERDVANDAREASAQCTAALIAKAEARAEAAERRLLPEKLTPQQKAIINDALTEWLMDSHFMADHAGRFHAILTRIEGERS